jgi:hypothetical protein
LLVCLVLGLAACDAQTDGAYKGEPLISFTGVVEGTGTGAVPAGGVDLVAAYIVIPSPTDPIPRDCFLDAKKAYDSGQAPDLGCELPYLSPERVEVHGDFPAQFHFELYQPPPLAARFDNDRDGVVDSAAAELLAVRAGAADDGKITLGELAGEAPYYLAWSAFDVADAYVCRQSAAGDVTCDDEPSAKGFHLFKLACGTAPSQPDNCGAVLADGEPIVVDLTDTMTIVDTTLRLLYGQM